MREIGKRLYFRNPSSNTVSSASKVGATTSTGSYVRYGTAQADNAEGNVQVKLDNSEDVVTCSCDSPIKQGDRVKVIVTESGALIAMPIGQNIVDYVDETKADLTQEITLQGNSILQEVNSEMDAFKANHQLTDDDIQHSITTAVSGATETWEGQLSAVEDGISKDYALKTEVTTEIGNLSASIAETYATTEGVQDDINTAIEVASGQITSTVEENVMNSVGDTFATKTEVEQTEQDLTIKINQSISNGYATCSTAAGTQAKVATSVRSDFPKATGTNATVKFTYGNTASNPTLNINNTGASPIYLGNSPITPEKSWSAGDTVTFVFDGTNWVVADASLAIAKTVETYFQATTRGLQVGLSDSPSYVMIGSSGYIRLNYGTGNWDYVNISSDSFSMGSAFEIYTENGGQAWVGGVEKLGTYQTGTTAFSTYAVNVSDLQNMCNNGDYITDYGTSGSIRYWEWANGRKECSGTMSLTMSAGGSAGARSVSLPLRYTDGYSYRVLLSMNNNSSNPPNFYNNVQLIAYNLSANRFYLTGWNTGSGSVTVTVGWYAIGV